MGLIQISLPLYLLLRITGWSAHIMEQHAANKLIRPLSKYSGPKHRKVLELNQRYDLGKIDYR